MKHLLIILLLSSGCTQFRVRQEDNSGDNRVITSDIRATAWFSSAQNIAKIKALQTDKTQSFGTDQFAQQGSTNTVAALQAIANILNALRPMP